MGMLTYDTLKENPRAFLAATSLTPEEFTYLLAAFAAAYESLYPLERTVEGRVRRRRAGGGAKGGLARIEDKLLFILIHQKTHPLQTMHGLQFGLGQPRANYWIHRLPPVLQRAPREADLAPERDAGQVLTHPLMEAGGTRELTLDGTERRRQRPREAARQRAHYSGKKKAHTDKNLLLVNEASTQVIYLSPTVAGKMHDKRAADEAKITYPRNATLDKDTGFQGYEPAGILTRQPQKKPKGRPLGVADQVLNRIFARARVVVEHVIAGGKRCRIVKDVLRLTKPGLSDQVMEIACGLHNLRVACRHPLPAFNLLSLLSLLGST